MVVLVKEAIVHSQERDAARDQAAARYVADFSALIDAEILKSFNHAHPANTLTVGLSDFTKFGDYEIWVKTLESVTTIYHDAGWDIKYHSSRGDETNLGQFLFKPIGAKWESTPRSADPS